VTPGIPIVTRDRPPDVRETYFQATAATLIYGVRDAVLVDAFMTVKQANALAGWVAARGKNLTTIYITHGHGDHWFGVGTLLERFPRAKAVATPNAVKVMRQNASSEALEGIWKAGFPGQIPDKLVIADELKGNVIDLEGHELVAVELGHTDTDYTTCLNVASVGLVVAGDAAYNDVHLYLAESNAQTRQEWIAALDAIESFNPRAVVAAHKRPENDDHPGIIEETRQYIRDSIASRKQRQALKTSTTGCWSSIPTGSIPGGRSGVRHARSRTQRDRVDANSLSRDLERCALG
jgi:glyoxylase-like metal-dependent hydrolase (beta-lactamase superfamily II)